MATFSLDQVEIFGTGVLQAEGVVIDTDGAAYGAGRNGIVYRVTPDETVSEMTHLPEGSMPNGVTMDREGNIVYCDLAKQAVLRVSQSGQVSFIADQVGDVKLTMPNFASYDAEGNLYVSNSSSAPTLEKALDELAQPAPRVGCPRPGGHRASGERRFLEMYITRHRARELETGLTSPWADPGVPRR